MDLKMDLKTEIWIYKPGQNEPCFILKQPSVGLLRRLKARGLYLIPRVY